MKVFLVMLAFVALIFSRVSMAKSYRGGHYYMGHGSTHKGGHYVNPRTGNHYTKRH